MGAKADRPKGRSRPSLHLDEVAGQGQVCHLGALRHQRLVSPQPLARLVPSGSMKVSEIGMPASGLRTVHEGQRGQYARKAISRTSDAPALIVRLGAR